MEFTSCTWMHHPDYMLYHSEKCRFERLRGAPERTMKSVSVFLQTVSLYRSCFLTAILTAWRFLNFSSSHHTRLLITYGKASTCAPAVLWSQLRRWNGDEIKLPRAAESFIVRDEKKMIKGYEYFFSALMRSRSEFSCCDVITGTQSEVM